MMLSIKKILKWLGIVIAVLAAIVFTLFLIYVRPVLLKIEHSETIHYDKQLTIVLGGGGNSGILVSDSMVLVIDTKMSDAAKKFADTVKMLAGAKPILVVNTHYHKDHTTGNVYYKGQTILAGGNYDQEIWIKHASEETLPNRWLKDELNIPMGDDTATIINFNRNAHTESDVFVYLHRRKMLFGGDVILNQQVPSIEQGADPGGYLEDFDALQKRFDIRKIVPGHGAMGGIEILEKFRQYFYDMKTAAEHPDEKDILVAKYKDWTQVPFLMSPDAAIKAFKNKKADK